MFPIVRVAPISSPITHGPWFDGNRVSSIFQLLAVYLAGSMSVVGMVFGLLFLGIKNAIYRPLYTWLCVALVNINNGILVVGILGCILGSGFDQFCWLSRVLTITPKKLGTHNKVVIGTPVWSILSISLEIAGRR